MSINDQRSIYIGLGANLQSSIGAPRQTIEAALSLLSFEVRIVQRSRFWRTRPVPVSDQPWFVNSVAEIETELSVDDLLNLLHSFEKYFGRKRYGVNAERVLDLDLLTYKNIIQDTSPRSLVPHPRMHERAFVLLPIMDIAPMWIHPRTGDTLDLMIATLSSDQQCIPCE
ncbi:MAG: 2-amino-4-hydroxy-6-hydroxymethyldihydropteridine diphosphokinase [Rhodospirillaceae bacterium]|jgi:2-amino-4-hydroxy-6-hydroxymethyldihydropteridine diphosphokinase|nr:2-amino-4-hydroxy-6-hydroxymethyldihydropteridine diphosphokinase [Rhodospirillaceae bacterium]